MRVLMLCGYFRPVVGGAEQQAELLARTLMRQGHEVEVLTPLRDATLPSYEVVEGLPIHRFAFTDLSRLVSGVRGVGLANLWIERGQVRRAVGDLVRRFDLLHTHLASFLVAFALEPAHACGVPVLCKVACGGSGFDFHALREGSILGARFVRRLVDGLDHWVAISDEVREDLRGAGVPDSRITSIPNGIDMSARSTTSVRGPVRRFLCLGRLHKFDFATLLTAFDTLAGEHPDVELRIAGRGDASDVEPLLAELPRARARTTVVGFSPSVEEMEWADAIVHPSRAEGMSNALLEAMCVGLPCVASDIAPNLEVLGDTALFFALGDPETLRAQLRRLVLEPALGASLAAAARRRVAELFSIDSVATRYGALYEELVQGRRQARRKTA